MLNGTIGIAVGMATSIPPHNLTEVCDGIMALIADPEISIDDLVKIIPGPDFPTGGIIYDKAEIKTAYATGKGGIVMRAKTEIVEEKRGSFVFWSPNCRTRSTSPPYSRKSRNS